MRLSSRILIALASLLALIGLLGTWVDRQLLDTGEWTRTSTALLRDSEVRDPVADAVADEIVPPSQPLVREDARRTAERLLSASGVQAVWTDVNRRTHRQFVALVRGDDADAADRGVVLDLRPLASAISERSGLDAGRVERLPAARARIVLIEPDQVQTLQTAGEVLDTLSWLPVVMALMLYTLAILLARADRRRALVTTGLGLVGVGLLALLARLIAGHELVEAVAGDGPYEPAALAVWRIATSLLADMAVAVIVAGALAALGAWLAGRGRSATRKQAVA